MNQRFFKTLTFAAVLMASTQCKTQMDPSYVEITGAVKPDATCLFSATNSVLGAGYFDPTVANPGGFQAGIVLKNNLPVASDDTVALFEVSNIHSEINDMQLLGFEGCWFDAAEASQNSRISDQNGFVNCDQYPDQSGWLVANQTVADGQTSQVIVLNLLSEGQLKQIFGSTFDPSLIPIEGEVAGSYVASSDPNLQGGFSYDTESPADTNTRSIYWGEKYPTQRDALVLVQIRAHLQSQSGAYYKSNWFTLPITVCPGCLQNTCGILVPKVCARGACSDSSICSSAGTCSDGSTCANTVLMSGERPNFTTGTSCLPAQNLGLVPITCESIGCDAAS